MLGVPGIRSLHRRVVAAALFGTAVAGGSLVATAVTAASAGAQPVTVNFNSLVPPDGLALFVANCYTESGFTFTAVGLGCGTPDAFVAAGPNNPPAYIGSPALYLNNPKATQVDLTRANGGLFSLQSIVLAPFFGFGGTVDFMGYRADGSTVFQRFMVPNASEFAVQPSALYRFNGDFMGLRSVIMTPVQPDGNPYINFDDVTFTPAGGTVVPEPTTVVLLAGGLFGVGLFARTRGSRRRAASTGA